jgi:hypothetical protein
MKISSGEKSYVAYFSMALGVLLFVMLYVWQSIEVMKLKLDYRKLQRAQESLVKVNDRLRYGIERYRVMDRIDADAARMGMRPVAPPDFEKVEVPR